MSSTPFTSYSMGEATVSATTWALDPGQMADTWTVGGATSGYWATGSPNRATTPTMTRTIDNTAAKIGRSMKTWEIMGVCASVSLEEGSVMPPRVAQTVAVTFSFWFSRPRPWCRPLAGSASGHALAGLRSQAERAEHR